MDIVFISYDEPSAEERFNELKKRFPRAKWCKGVTDRHLHMYSRNMSDTITSLQCFLN